MLKKIRSFLRQIQKRGEFHLNLMKIVNILEKARKRAARELLIIQIIIHMIKPSKEIYRKFKEQY